MSHYLNLIFDYRNCKIVEANWRRPPYCRKTIGQSLAWQSAPSYMARQLGVRLPAVVSCNYLRLTAGVACKCMRLPAVAACYLWFLENASNCGLLVRETASNCSLRLCKTASSCSLQLCKTASSCSLPLRVISFCCSLPLRETLHETSICCSLSLREITIKHCLQLYKWVSLYVVPKFYLLVPRNRELL